VWAVVTTYNDDSTAVRLQIDSATTIHWHIFRS